MNPNEIPPPPKREKPKHYKVICVSLYNADLAALDMMVEALKARGVPRVSRSSLIRYALEQLDITSATADLKGRAR